MIIIWLHSQRVEGGAEICIGWKYIFLYPLYCTTSQLQTISTCNISYIDCGPVEEYSIEWTPFSGSRACTAL